MAKKEIELLSKRVQSLEILVKELKLEVVLKRIKFIEETLFSTKDILNAKEVCLYLDISQSLLYKLTSSGEIPHFKPRGKMVFFEKKELEKKRSVKITAIWFRRIFVSLWLIFKSSCSLFIRLLVFQHHQFLNYCY